MTTNEAKTVQPNTTPEPEATPLAWAIPHPGTGQWLYPETLELAMNKWFEGHNIPVFWELLHAKRHEELEQAQRALLSAEAEAKEAKRLLANQDGPYVFENGQYVCFYELLNQRDAAIAELARMKAAPTPPSQLSAQEELEIIMLKQRDRME